jgi:hypothetical protein
MIIVDNYGFGGMLEDASKNELYKLLHLGYGWFLQVIKAR